MTISENPILRDDQVESELARFRELPEGPERASIGQRLTQWRDRAREAMALDKDKQFESLYAGLESARARVGNVPMLEAAPDPDETVAGGINQRFVSEQWGKPMEEISPIWPAWRTAYAMETFGKDVKTDKELYSLIAGKVTQKKAQREFKENLGGRAVVHAFEDISTGSFTSPVDRVREEILKNPEAFKGLDEADVLRQYSDGYAALRKEMAPYQEPAKRVFDYLSSWTGAGQMPEGDAKTRADVEKLAGMFVDIAPAERQKVYEVVALAAKANGAGDTKEWAQKLGESFARGLTGMFDDTAIMAKDAETRNNLSLLRDQGAELVVWENGRIDTIESARLALAATQGRPGQTFRPVEAGERDGLLTENSERLKQTQVLRELKSLADGTVDPIRASADGLLGRFEQGTYDAARSVPYTLAAGVPYVGPILTYTALAASDYNRLMLDNPEMDSGAAMNLAMLTAGPQAAIERFQFGLITGKLPGFSQWMKAMTDARVPIAARIAAGVGGVVAAENVTEGIQDAIPVVSDTLAASIRQDMPNFDPEKAWGDWENAGWDRFFAVLPLALIGGGTGVTVRELKRTGGFLQFKQELRMGGIEEATAGAIAAETDPDKQTAMIVEAWEKRTPESIAEGDRIYEETQAATKEAQGDAGRPTMDVSRDADGTPIFVVRDATGAEKYRTQNANAAEQAFLDEARNLTERQLFEQEQAMQGDEGQIAAARDKAGREIITGEFNQAGDVRNVFTFQPVKDEDLTPNEQDRLSTFRQSAKNKGARAEAIRIVLPQLGRDGNRPDARGETAFEFLKNFERLTGRSVTFFEADPGFRMSGGVLQSNPDQIWINAGASRNLFALVGHEWGHTVQHSQPEIWKKLKPFILSHADNVRSRAKALKDPLYKTPKKLTTELANNMIGDAFADPEFWKALAEKDRSLFEKILDVIKRWFDSLAEQVGNSEWGTQVFTNQLREMHEGLAEFILDSATSPDTRFDGVGDSELSAATNREYASIETSQEARRKLIPSIERNIRSIKDERLAGFEVTKQDPDDVDPGNDPWETLTHKESDERWFIEKMPDGKWMAENNGSFIYEDTREAAIESAKKRLAEEINEVRGVFGKDLDNSYEVEPLFEIFNVPEGIYEWTGWFRTKWGSWYAEGQIEDDYGNFQKVKLSVRDHDATRADMGLPDHVSEVSKDWTPTEVAKALDRAETWLAKKANPAISDGAAGIKTDAPKGAADKSNVAALQPGNGSTLTPKESANPVQPVNPESPNSRTPSSGDLEAATMRDTDAAYLKAVESGDMDTAQRMVDEAAKAAGERKLYHVGQMERPALRQESVTGGVGEVYLTEQPTAWAAALEREGDPVSQWYLPDSTIAKTQPSRRELVDWAISRGFMEMKSVTKPDGTTVFELDDKTPLIRPEETLKGKSLPFYNTQDPMRGGNQQKHLIYAYLKERGFAAYEAEYSRDGHEIIVFAPSQIKSAAPVTRDASGNVIPLSQRFNPESDNINFATMREESVNAEFQKRMRNPDQRLAVFERAKKKLTGLMLENRPVIEAMEFSRGASKRELEAGGMKKAERHQITREKLLQSIGELDALLSVFPAEIRGKVGGFAVLANIGTGEKALTDFFVKRIEMLDKELERALRKEYDAKLQKLFNRAKPKKDEAGKKRVGKAGADVHSLFDTLREAVNWTETEVEAHVRNLEAEIAKGEMTAEQEAHALQEISLVSLLGNWRNADSERREIAVNNATEVFAKGYGEFKIKKMEERDRRKAVSEDLAKDTGVTGSPAERDARAIADNGLSAGWKNSALSLLNFEQAVKWVFGEKSVQGQRLADMEREASNKKSDREIQKMAAIESLFTRLAGGSKLAGQKLQYDLSRKTMDLPTGRKLSQLEAIKATMMWQQEDGQRHMIGQLDENGKPVGGWHYDQAFIDAIESKLSPEAKEVRAFLMAEYAREYAEINPVYRALNGIDMPGHKNYSPLTVKPMKAQSGQEIDPVTGTTLSTGSFTPGSLRTRGTATAEPEFSDALQTYIAHTKQIGHWMAYAPFNAEASAILNSRDLGNVVESKAGQEAVLTLRGWLDLFARGGVRDAGATIWWNRVVAKILTRATSVALVGRIGTLAIQSTQLGAAIAEMPTKDYAARIGKLFAGQLGWGEAFKSPYIQRRLAELPPIVRQALDGLRAEKPNQLRYAVAKLGQLIGGADALFTAGTYAIVFDYQMTQAKEIGLTGKDAEAYARNAAERAVDRIAQPTRTGARSLYENTLTNPLARVGWAFFSEARKNLGLAAYSAMNRSPQEAARVLTYVVLINGIMATIIRSAWRDMRDDDDDELFDEKNWSPAKIGLSVLTEPLYGIPGLGDAFQAAIYAGAGKYTPSGNLFDSLKRSVPAVKRIPDTLTGEQETEEVLRDVEAMLSGFGLFNSNFAAAASLSHLARDLFGVGQNVNAEE